MAEYYPLLDRAVSGLAEQSADARRAIYERARAALLGQLRRMDPPIPDEAIARESDALDDAIAQLELKFAAAPGTEPPSDPLAPRLEAPRPPPAAGLAETAPVRTSLPPPPAPGPVPSILPPSRERPTIGERPAPSLGGDLKPLVPPRPPSVRPTSSVRISPIGAPAPRGTRPVMALRPVSPPVAPIAAAASAAAGTGLPLAGMLPKAASASSATGILAEPGTTFEAALDEARDEDANHHGSDPGDADTGLDRPPAAPARPRDVARPLAPRPVQPARFGLPFISGAVIVAVLMVATGIAAYRMRDRPEQVIANHTDVLTSEGATPGKIVDRAAGSDGADVGGADGAALPATGQAAGAAGFPDAGPAIAVAQRAGCWSKLLRIRRSCGPTPARSSGISTASTPAKGSRWRPRSKPISTYPTPS